MDLTVVRFVLDTNIILYFLGGRLAEPLPAGPYTISVISELELLAYPGLVPSEEQRVRAFLADIAVTELTQTIKSHAKEGLIYSKFRQIISSIPRVLSAN